MADKYGIHVNRFGSERAVVVKITKQTKETHTYIAKRPWPPNNRDFSGRETRVHAQPAAVFDTLDEAEARAELANAAWASFVDQVSATRQAYLDAEKAQYAAFKAAITGAST